MKYGLKKVKSTTVNGELHMEARVLVNEDGEVIVSLDEIFQEFDGEAISITVKRVVQDEE